MYFRFSNWTRASSISSPPTLSDLDVTIPDRAITAISVVPPPMSITIDPTAPPTGRSIPMAAAIGSAIR